MIAVKEFRELLYNPKFLLLFTVSLVLILLSLFNGYSTYDGERRSATLGQEVALRDAEGMENYQDIGQQGLRISRAPDRMSIFSQGISGVVGRKSLVRWDERPRPRDSRYSLDPILAVFGELDLTFTVGMILSLFALLFAYNAVSGEREAGTLGLMMANPVRRSSMIFGKLVGGYLPLALLFLVPFLLGLAALMLITGINFAADEWLRIAMLGLAAPLYLLVFYTIGLAMSALTRSSFASFLFCLFIWVLSVVIVPRMAVQTASQINPSMPIDEVESRILSYQNDRRMEFPRRMNEYFETHEVNLGNINQMVREARRIISQEIAAEDAEFQDSVFAEFDREREEMMRTASLLSRISPTSCFSFTMNSLTNTGTRMLEEFERDLQFYRRSLSDYLQQKQEEFEENMEGPMSRSFRVLARPGGMSVEFSEAEQAGNLDLSMMPRFAGDSVIFAESAGETIPDYAILALYAIGSFALAFVAFLRYDVR